jgi:hypothetical protein
VPATWACSLPPYARFVRYSAGKALERGNPTDAISISERSVEPFVWDLDRTSPVRGRKPVGYRPSGADVWRKLRGERPAHAADTVSLPDRFHERQILASHEIGFGRSWPSTPTRAARIERAGRDALAGGHRVSAREALLRASNYYRAGDAHDLRQGIKDNLRTLQVAHLAAVNLRTPGNGSTTPMLSTPGTSSATPGKRASPRPPDTTGRGEEPLRDRDLLPPRHGLGPGQRCL